MSLRSTVLAAALTALAVAPVPALAKDSGMGEVTAKLSDPRTQSAVAGALAALSEALLSMKMAPLAKAMESMEGVTGGRKAMPRIDPDATLRDLAGPSADRLPQELSEKVPAMMGAMGGMAGAMEAMLPELEKIGERMKDAIPAK